MKVLDPTYLRYVYDGLQSRELNSDNPSGLPNGLVGVYEKAFANSNGVIQRSKLLEFFSVWVILKKDVSSAFILPLLPSWTEDEVLECIADYSRWFNSPLSGKYQLYHERLRTFVLQKLSADEFRRCNESVIRICREVLATKSNDEWDIYALEHLSTHLLVPAMEGLDSVSLKTLAYDTAHWNRQIDISKGYDWTKKMHHEMMLWASKYDDEQVIECALNKVDLYHMEQNDALRIVELVAQNDIDLALASIEAFGGNDEEGVQRKFIVYMLTLMELTLLESKDKPFRRDAIQKLLKHLDHNLPLDHSTLNWSIFFPSYLIFLMTYEWALMGLEYMVVYKFTKWWDHNWIDENGPYDSFEYEILIQIAFTTNVEWERCSALTHISSSLAKEDKNIESYSLLKKALDSAQKISKSHGKRSEALINISIELARHEKISESYLVLQEALISTRLIIDERAKCFDLMLISTQLSKQGNELESSAVYSEALYTALLIEDEQEKNLALMALSIELAKQGKLQESLEISNKISVESNKNFALTDIYAELITLGLVSNLELDESIRIAIDTARGLKSNRHKSKRLKDISINLAKQEKRIFANQVLYEALEAANEITDDDSKCFELKEISTELANQGKYEDALHIILEMSSGLWKNDALKNLSTKLAKEGKLFQLFHAMVFFLETKRGISDSIQRDLVLKSISIELASQTRITESLETVHFISDPKLKILVLNEISQKFMTQDYSLESDVIMKKAVNAIDRISNKSDKISAMLLISNEFSKQGKILESENKLRAALEIAKKIANQKNKICSLVAISSELMNYGKILDSNFILQEATTMSLAMTDDSQKIFVQMVISTELLKQGNDNDSEALVQASIESTLKMSNQFWKNSLLKTISTELAKQNKILKALEIAKEISDDDWSSLALMDICIELAQNGMSIEILKTALSIVNDWHRSLALKAVAINLAKKFLWNIVIEVVAEIPRTDERQECWKEIAKTMTHLHETTNTFDLLFNFKSYESQVYYLKGWVESLSIEVIDKLSMKKVLQLIWFDTLSVEKLLQVYSFNKIFFSKTSFNKLKRLDRTLNIQWAIDLRKSN